MTEIQLPSAWKESKWHDIVQGDALKTLRAQAWSRFETTGFPTAKNEAWRYTAVSPVSGSEFHRLPVPKPDARIIRHLQGRLDSFKNFARLIFIDGWLISQLSDLKLLEESADFSPVRELAVHRPTAVTLDAENVSGFSAMNAALFQDGVWLNIRDQAAPAAPLLIYFLHTSAEPALTFQLKHWISLGKKSKLKIFEWHDSLSDSGYFMNQEFHVRLAPESSLEHTRLQGAGSRAWLRSLTEVKCSDQSAYERFDLETGAAVSRNEIQAHLSGGGSRCRLTGVVLGSGDQHFDTQTAIDHAVPSSTSDQACRNLLSGKARAVFGGHVRVRPGAQKTDARQVHKTLLLSDEARADTKPQLQIDADDVQCSHGAAIGQLDEDSLFYLQSRGIARTSAEKILATGFVEHLLAAVSDEFLKKFMTLRLEAKLNRVFQ